MEGVVAPLDQRYAVPLLAVRVTLPPLQNVVGPLALMVGVEALPMITEVADEVAEHPPAWVTLTVKFPLVLVVMDWVVDPFDHR